MTSSEATGASDDRPAQGATPTVSPASGSNGRTVLAIVLVLIGTAYVIYSIWRTPPGGGERGEHHPAAGRTLFFVSLRSVDDGRLVGLTDFAGKVTLLNFWGTWCPPCREELPRLQVLAQEFATHEDFAVAAVSYPFGEDVDPRTLATETRQFLDATGLKLPVYLDVDNQTMTAADLIVGVPGFPTTIILDRSGKIRGVWNGYQRGYEQEMHELVARLLAEPYQVSMPELTITGQEYLVPLEGEEPPP